jgi:glycosyltransferase involved in cell wall biosynthesis
MPNKVIILVTKITEHFVLLVSEEIKKQMDIETVPICLFPARLSFRKLKTSESLSDEIIFNRIDSQSGNLVVSPDLIERCKGKDVVLLATDHTVLTSAENVYRAIASKIDNIRKYVMLLDIPMDYYSGKHHYYSDYIASWDTIKRELSRGNWDLIAVKTPTYYNSYFYLNKMPVGKVFYPVFFEEPTKPYKGARDYAISCASINEHKGQAEIIEMFKDLKDELDLYFVGSGPDEVKCKNLAAKHGITLRILSEITETEKYNFIAGAKFGISGERGSYCGSGTIAECMWCGKTSVVWDNPLNREMYLDKHILFARTPEEFTAQMKKALTFETDIVEMKEFLNSRYSKQVFVQSLRKIIWPNG